VAFCNVSVVTGHKTASASISVHNFQLSFHSHSLDYTEMAVRTPINVIKRVWERIAPLQLAETSWDNVSSPSQSTN
jgi:hypothetical protein